MPAAYYDFAWAPAPVKADYGTQWWVYPHHKDAPRDLASLSGGGADMPLELRRELAELGLL